MPRESRAFLTVLSVCIAALTSCGGSSSSSVPIPVDPIELVVVDFEPAFGAVAVGPGTQVRVTFSRPVDGLTVDDLTVADSGGQLAGVLEASPDALTWAWRAIAGLPRGATLTVRLAGGIRSRDGALMASGIESTFTVREVITGATYEVPNGPGKVLLWPNGRRAVTVGSRSYEVVTGSLIERPFLFEDGDLAYGDGSFLTRVGTPAGAAIARRHLEGSEQLILVPTPNVRAAAVNTMGDAVLVDPIPATFPSSLWQLWRLPLGAQVPESLQAVPADALLPFAPVIAEDGAVVVGYRDAATGLPSLMRFAANSTVADVYTVEETGLVGDVLCGIDADGVATLVWLRDGDTLRAAHLEPGGSLVPVPDDLQLNAPGGTVSLELKVARSGSSVVQVSTQVGAPAFVVLDDFVRLERSGWVGFPERYGSYMPASPQVFTQFDAARGEWWGVRLGPALGTLERLRSPPGMSIGEPSLIYESPVAGQFISAVWYAFDEYGRAVVVLTEAYPSPRTFVVVLE